MCATSIVPAFFKLVFTKGNRGPLSVIIDIFALLMQCSVFFLMTRYFTTERIFITDLIRLLEIAASLFLISLRYWENYIDRDVGILEVQAFKQTMRNGRCKTYIFASLWKIALTLAFAYVLVPDMTPMADIFSNIANETAYDNSTNLEIFQAYDFDSNSTNIIPEYYQAEDYNYEEYGTLRLKRQADDDILDYEDSDPRRRNRNRNQSTRRPRNRARRPRPTPPPLYPELYEYDAQTEVDNSQVNKILYRFLPLIIQSASGAICYYFSRLACKLCMQGFSLMLPLTLLTPATISIFCYLCHLDGWTRIGLPHLTIGHWPCPEIYLENSFHWQIGCALGLWWLSQLWISNHMWFSKSERLAKVER